MPLVDVRAPVGLFPREAERPLAEQLARWDCASSDHTCAGLTPASRLNPDAQRGLIREATDIVARLAGEPTQATRTWVLLTEAAPGGWGIAGTVPTRLQQLQETLGAQPAS